MLLTLSRYHQAISWLLVSIFYAELVLIPVGLKASPLNILAKRPVNYSSQNWSSSTAEKSIPSAQKLSTPAANLSATKNAIPHSGPGQPEMQSFSSTNNSNMVDLFSGDFSYNIPLMDVGGYPVTLSYRSGISMDQEASWVGLGWNVNPGTVNRNMRGLPDDFDGRYDSIKKTMSIKENRTVGVTAGASAELVGLPIGLGASLGLFHNTYKGWGLENGLNASINAGNGASGFLSGGLSITNNTQEGVTISPSFSAYSAQQDIDDMSSISGGFSLSLPYNSRSGLKALQLSAGLRQYYNDGKNQASHENQWSTNISFASPAFTPSITIPYTSRQFSFTAKTGILKKTFFSNLYISGYVSSQTIAKEDTSLSLPAFGYMNLQETMGNSNALLDFNLEKDLPYREKPPVPHIAIPSYTYDAFSITGEGAGGMFRAYRGDIGFVHDHSMRTKDVSDRASLDFGGLDIVHAGVDLNVNRAYSQNGPWIENNTFKNIIGFKRDSAEYEAVYFRNPGEKSINSKKFYDAIGGDDLVAINLFQPSKSSSFIQATNYLTRYQNKRAVENKLLTKDSAYKRERDKRTQVITYLTAKEADIAGVSRYIDNYKPNQFTIESCAVEPPVESNGQGLNAEYFKGQKLEGEAYIPQPQNIDLLPNSPIPSALGIDDYSIRWTGRLKAYETGKFTLSFKHDDGLRVWMNDSLLIDDFRVVEQLETKNIDVYLIKDEFYKIKVEYFEYKGPAQIQFLWSFNDGPQTIVPVTYLFGEPKDILIVNTSLTKEKRINSFRKPNHISEISVLNNDGRRYIYGIPVYNLKQREATFAVDPSLANLQTGLVGYSNEANSTGNIHGNDHYFKSEETPAYAHSYLLTSIMSADYVDVSGNGISDDDLGDAVKLNYSKVSGIKNPFKWRTPYIKDKVNYNEGLKTDKRDDKGNFIHGEKELWYLHSIESKTMVATFTTSPREDLLCIDERGQKQNTGVAQKLVKIDLYSKADFAKRGTLAVPVKTVNFEYSYELCQGINSDIPSAGGKLTLKKVWFTYNNNTKGYHNPYVFNYANNQSYQQKAYDRWGNYKNPLNNPGSGSSNIIGNDEYPYAVQDSLTAAINAAAWTLDSIYLPSGGAIKVDYESDDYAFVQNKRAMNMVKPLGFGATPSMTSGFSSKLYNGTQENNYIYFSVSGSVTNKAELYRKYLEGIQKLYFRLFVTMPTDIHGGGNEYISGYADIDSQNGYGISGGNIAWIKLAGVSLKGDDQGIYSPLAKAAIQFLRLNLPSKAYPESEPGDNLSASSAVRMLVSSFGSVVTAFSSFDALARKNNWAASVDLGRSFIRLNNQQYKKYGGGHRVKRIRIFDNWNKMAQRRSAIYGQEYSYSTQKEINGLMTSISSGVASYEPGIGGEENPFRQPIEYVDKAALLGPVTLGYSEEPLGESFFPSASVGYSKVRVRTINHINARSANGFDETRFFTTYDFPTYTDRSLLDESTKKRFKPSLANFLRINVRHHIALSQGYKIELNDMNGKLRSKASFSENDHKNPIIYTENIYKTESLSAEHKRLSNKAMVIDAAGNIDSNAIIGKDVELMVAMREQLSVNNGFNVNVNVDVFSVPLLPPVLVLPSFFTLYQREENLYRSVAAMKVIQRYGILDSVISIEKGSKVSTKDLLYDSETGDVLLSRTQNEFNDPIYNFTYPSHWAYNTMGLAYKNINLTFKHVTIKRGRIIQGINNPETFFSSGDEMIVEGKLQTNTGEPGCNVDVSTFPAYQKIWSIDGSILDGGANQVYFIDRNGVPYNGDDVTLKIIRSGRRNILASVGSFASLKNPLQYMDNKIALNPETSSKILAAKAVEYSQFWKVEDRKVRDTSSACFEGPLGNCSSSSSSSSSQQDSQLSKVDTSFQVLIGYDCHCLCLSELFDYLITSKRLFIRQSDNITINSLIIDANNAGYNLAVDDCPILSNNLSNLFYALSTDSISNQYMAKIGNCRAKLLSSNSSSIHFYALKSKQCSNVPIVNFRRYDDFGQNLTIATLQIESCTLCDIVNAEICRSVVSDTAFNPYMAGVLGNWRQNKSYTYYGQREQTDPETGTDIRKDGAYADFIPFWEFENNMLQPKYDVNRWIWNSESTLFNRKGLEIENRDPLGRFNAGLYGYNLTMPVAVTQNSRYRESGFDGFEDYDFITQLCDTVCAANRQMDFSNFTSNLDTERKHSGKSSLRLNDGSDNQVSLQFDLSDETQDASPTGMNFNSSDACGVPALQDIKMSDAIILPSFSPLKGKRMVLSAWVREDQDCKCSTYVNNSIIVLFDQGSISFTFYPSGSIVEGWQRYEAVFDIPVNASTISVSLRATGSVPVNFDDVRIHPYNANMKSFVFHPSSLRLLAELDENNYATFYEYDDDGTLIRLKRETQRGIKTIKETRSALLKE